MATCEKPATRYGTSDWFTSNYAISTNAERQRGASHDIRQEARFLRNETDNKTKWDQLDTNTRLSDRVDHIRQWKDILDRTLAKLDQEIKDLSDAKDDLEVALENMNLPCHVNIENLTTREGRMDIDVVEDAVEDQLKKEQKVIEGIKQQLQQNIHQAFEQLCVLQEARQQVLADLQDKNVALGIDVDQYNLTDESSEISFKPDPTRVMKGSTTPQQWEDFSRYNHDRAVAEMSNSQHLREAIFATLEQTANDLKSQDNATDYALRKRMHEMQMAIDELNWQKQQTEDEIAELETEIRRLVDAIRAKINPTKLAETRLENRTYRPNVELCRDNVQYGLTDEVKQLYASKASLEEKLRQSQHALDGLEKKLHRINEDLHCKTNSLKLDEMCVQNRSKLTMKNRPQTTSERNMTLMGMSRERAKILA
ncbi:hypothetical protein NP493_203g00011 [Ridgeia piscesae]|uniref:Tektin n=1 Tax=Ridgeia piscesae TaxID=27915 RepID=A0AAD9UEH5_RIDPI|nr:hypothetical protein NP493_203g00011 [Ridgeia piscesae]